VNWTNVIIFSFAVIVALALLGASIDMPSAPKNTCENKDMYIGYNGTVFLDGFTFIFKRCEYMKDNETARCAGLSFGNKTVLIDTDMPLSNLKIVCSHEICHESLEAENEEELCKFEHNITFDVCDKLYNIIEKISYCVIR